MNQARDAFTAYNKIGNNDRRMLPNLLSSCFAKSTWSINIETAQQQEMLDAIHVVSIGTAQQLVLEQSRSEKCYMLYM